MERIDGHIYDYPTYYDLVFSADWRDEYNFLLDAFAQHAQTPLRRIFEPGCGTGRLLWRLAAAGHEVAGLDLNPAAVEFCNERMTKKGLAPAAQVGDMTQFQLDQPADLAFNLINTFRHLLTAQQAENHLHAMADALAPGGLYLLGLHLFPTGGDPSGYESWTARRGRLQVVSELQTVELDTKKRFERFTMTFRVTTPTKAFELVEPITFRTYTARQMQNLLAKEPRFELVETYDFDYDLTQPITVDSTTEDVVYVLRRR